jgi:uncharacterized iron-regulated protein
MNLASGNAVVAIARNAESEEAQDEIIAEGNENGENDV